MTSKRKLYREDEKLFFLHSYYQSGMSKHAFCRAHGICCPALLNSWIKKYSNLAEELSLPSEQESPDMSNRSKEAYKDEKTRSHTDGFQRNNAKCLDEKGISRFVPHSSI